MQFPSLPILPKEQEETQKENLRNFLGIALGSSFELETQLLIARNLGYIHENEIPALSDKLDKIQKMIYKLQQQLNIKK